MKARSMRLVSQRLILRDWQEDDRLPFAEMSLDPTVMEHLRPLTTKKASDAWIDFQIKHQRSYGFCLWAVELRSTAQFIGCAGLLRLDFPAPFTPAVEIGWRLARAFWSQGFATEAAQEALKFGFDDCRLEEIVAHAGIRNVRSHRVMTKLGMSHDDADDFDHPKLGETDPLRRQVLYRLSRSSWQASASSRDRC